MYTGNGSIAEGWPAELTWVSFQDLWCANQHIIARSCNMYYNTTNNSDEEMEDLRNAINIVSHETRVDHRFIFAAVMQETKGCVRAASTVSKDGIHNPGLLQDFKGTYSCNDGSKIQTPCPKAQIEGMIRDGSELIGDFVSIQSTNIPTSCRDRGRPRFCRRHQPTEGCAKH